MGVIGRSGAGKSTLVDVVLGLLTPDAGQVRVDGQDIQRNLRAWQDQIGYVPQAVYLTDDTLRRNVAFGLPGEQIDEVAVRRAIRSAQLEEFVASLPDGLETVVGERGVRLSGGQRQRIGIARALYHDPRVLILEQATSSLDADTEEGIIETVRACAQAVEGGGRIRRQASVCIDPTPAHNRVSPGRRRAAAMHGTAPGPPCFLRGRVARGIEHGFLNQQKQLFADPFGNAVDRRWDLRRSPARQPGRMGSHACGPSLHSGRLLLGGDRLSARLPAGTRRRVVGYLAGTLSR